MDMEFSTEDFDDSIEGFDDIDDLDDVMEDLTAESRVVEIIDEMEFVEDDLDFFDESEIQREIAEMF